MYDYIEFQNPRLNPSGTRKREAGVFKNLLSGRRIWKPAFSLPENAVEAILGDPGADSGGERKLLCFSAQSKGRTAATVWNWSGKTLSPGALLAVLYFSSCHIFRPFRLSLAPTICPWVSEDAFRLKRRKKSLFPKCPDTCGWGLRFEIQQEKGENRFMVSEKGTTVAQWEILKRKRVPPTLRSK